MNSFKWKILIVFGILAATVLGLAAYSLVNSNAISRKIEAISEPDHKLKWLRDMTTNLSMLTNLYRKIGSDDVDYEAHDQLLNSVRSSLDSLTALYLAKGLNMPPELESIPAMLDSIKRDSDEILKLRSTYNADFKGRMHDVIMEAMAKANLTDSVLVESSSQREVVRIVEKELLAEITAEMPDNRNFFQRLFSRSEDRFVPPQSSESQDKLAKDSDPIFKEIGRDTIAFDGRDTLIIARNNVDVFTAEVSKILERERKALRQIEERENALYEINLELITDLDAMITLFRRERQENLNAATQSTLSTSLQFSQTLTYIVIGFGVASLVMLALLFRDIEKNRYYQELLEKNEKQALRTADEKQRFLSTMSHELRTPLTAIIGYTDLMKSDKNPHVEAIRASSKYLMNIANDILDIAKIKAGKIEVHFAPTNLNALVQEVRAKCEPLIVNAGLEARFIIPDAPIIVMTDATRIEQVLYNLMHNAVKFTSSGFVSLNLQTLPQADDSVAITIEISDSGKGIDEAEIQNIFTDYHQAGTLSENALGTGLGLGIVKQIMHHLGGGIEVRSKKGKGSTFTLAFTAKNCQSLPELNSAGTDVNSDFSLNGMQICVVDDDPFIANLYQIIFSKHGARVMPFIKATEALKFLEFSKTDILITDIKMPQMGGRELVQKLIEKGCRPQVVIAASANLHPDLEKKSDGQLFDKIILKPFTQDQLIQILSELLNGIETTSPKGAVEDGTASNQPLNQAINLGELRKYAMGDEDAFQTIIRDLYTTNASELGLLKASLDQGRLKTAAEHLHKLSSRFAQIKVKTTYDPAWLELVLREDDASALKDSYALCEAWKEINDQLLDATEPNINVQNLK